jgi:hypothetical protein
VDASNRSAHATGKATTRIMAEHIHEACDEPETGMGDSHMDGAADESNGA